MRRPLRLASLALATWGLVAVAHAGVSRPELPGTRPLGMGNAFVAVADDRNALYYNPAGLARLEGTHIAGLGVRGAVDDQLSEVVRFVKDHEDQFTNFDAVDTQFLDELARYDDRWVGADANAYVDVTRSGFGVGVFGTANAQVKVDRGVYEPRVLEDALSDVVGVVGGGMPLGRADLSVGGTLKAIWRRQSDRVITAREAADFDFQQIVDDLEGANAGFSMDLGTLWTPSRTWSAGAVMHDGTGWIGGQRIDSSLDVGTAWSPWRPDAGIVQQLLLAADVDGVGGGGALGKHLCFGAEARLPVVTLRAGAHQGYGTFGASLALPGVHLDYAYWGRELGETPGAEDQFLHTVELRIGT
jgi:hypothetical protein